MSERATDRSGRWRNRTVAFRMSDEEAKMLDRLVAMSGQTKRAYIASKLLDRTITVTPSVRVLKALSDVANELLAELRRLESAQEMTQELQEATATLATVLASLGGEHPATTEDPMLLIIPEGWPGNDRTDQSEANPRAESDYTPAWKGGADAQH